MSAGENFKFIFREAKINDAILFFDECESIFESRELGGRQVNLLLTEIERYATNLPVLSLMIDTRSFDTLSYLLLGMMVSLYWLLTDPMI